MKNRAILIHTALTGLQYNCQTEGLFPDFLCAKDLGKTHECIHLFIKHYMSGAELGDGDSVVN